MIGTAYESVIAEIETQKTAFRARKAAALPLRQARSRA
jgi:hypothetical protein